METKRIPMIGQVVARDGNTDYGQYFTNAHFTVFQNPVTGGQSMGVVAQEGFSQSVSVPNAASGTGTAVLVWTGNANLVCSAFGATNSTIYVSSSSLGAITGIAGYISETVDSSNVATLFITSENNRGYYYTNGGSLTEITDTDFPPKQTPARTITGNFVHFDGFSGIMCTDGTFWHNNIGAPATWTSTANISAQDQPDAGVAAIRKGSYIILFGKASYEPHINTGNTAGAVLSRVTGASRRVGLINQYSLVNFQDTVAWIGVQDGVAVFMMDGLEPVRISTFPIEVLLRQNANNCRLHVITSHSRPRLMLSLDDPSTCTTGFVYDQDLKIWTRVNFGSAKFRQFSTHQLMNGTVYGCFFVGTNSTGFLYFNNGEGIGTVTAQTAPIDFGTGKRKFLNAVRLIGESYVVNTVTLKYSDDGGVTFGGDRTLELGRITSKQIMPEVKRLGMFTRRQFQLSWNNSTAGALTRIDALEFDYSVGSV